MNNEEIILQLLSKLDQGQEEIRVGQENLRVGQEELRVGQEELRVAQEELRVGQETIRSDLKNLNNRLTNLELHIENETDKLLKEIASDYNTKADNFVKASEKIDALEFDIINLKKVVISHSKEINRMMGIN